MRMIDADALDKRIYNDVPISTFGSIRRMAAVRELIEEAPTVEPAAPWHRVEDELPEIGKAVVVSIYGDMWVATRLDDKRFNGRMYWELSDGSWERVENDMYWMPIEPPKEEEE